MRIPSIATIDSAPLSVLRGWWRSVDQPATDEERDVVEHLAIRCEGCGLVSAAGDFA